MTADKWKVIGVMLLATLAVSLGETLLAKGMKGTNSAAPGAFAQARARLASPLIKR